MLGQTLGHYRIEEKLGAGGMGEVYRATDEHLHRDVAIKVLPQGTLDNEEARKRFRKEALTLSKLNHPNVAHVYDFDTQEGADFLVMEYVPGASLAARLKDGPLPESEVLRIGGQVAEALNEAHSHGIIHRDLKPANIALDSKGNAKVLDFGIAKLLHASEELSQTPTVDTLTKTAGMSGTLPYMAPEQLSGKPADERSDIHALGVVMYEMTAGQRPFAGTDPATLIRNILEVTPTPLPKLSKETEDTSENLDLLIRRCLEKNPSNRFQSAAEIREAMHRVQTGDDAAPWLYDSAATATVPHTHTRWAMPWQAVAFAIVVLLAVGTVAWWWLNRSANIRRATEVLLPEIERLVETSWRDYTESYELAVEAEMYIPDHPRLAELLAKSSLKISVNTEPAGAAVYMKRYSDPESEWQHLGLTPIENIRVPVGIFRWKMEKDGYETVHAAASTWEISMGEALLVPNNLVRVLDEKGVIPPGMVRVRGSITTAGELSDFYIDKYEVTNRQYKKFIDGGGYTNRKYWNQEFVKDGKILTWEDALAEFVDQTGRPGPATWQAGDHPEGQGDHPVGGISWYEAAAFCESAGKSLPTGYHWGLARGEDTPLIRWPQLGGFAVFAPFSNIGAGTGPVPVGSLRSITAYGASDMAGNVREWVWNETERGRAIRGGAWSDNTYQFNVWSQAPAFDRSPQNGFRCAVYLDPEAVPQSAFQIAKTVAEFLEGVIEATHATLKKPPVPDSVFQIFKQIFDYDATDLDARVDSRDESSEKWIHEKISFDAAYGDERVIAHLFLPRNSTPPYQTVVYFPGAATVFQDSSENIVGYYEYEFFLSFIVKNGRAALFPVYKGTFERRDDSLTPLAEEARPHRAAQYRAQLVKDFRRSLDYLETRSDIDADKIAYYGMSWGAALGAIIPAVETRIKASILLAGGLHDQSRPEVNQITYAPRVKVPTLMINGRYDTLAPYETSIKPLFDLLGTPEEHKELKLYETDHIPPMNEFIKETLAWLDRYLGPVQ